MGTNSVGLLMRSSEVQREAYQKYVILLLTVEIGLFSDVFRV